MQIDTYSDMANILHLKPQSVKRNGDRKGYEYHLNDKLPMPVVLELVNDYQKPAPRRTDKTMRAAKKLAKTITSNTTVNVQVNNIVNSDDKGKVIENDKGRTKAIDKAKTRALSKDNDKNVDKDTSIPAWIIAIVLLPALVWQMEHYATVVNDLSRITSNGLMSYVFSWFFAFSVTGTAIVMTAAKGNRNYLYGFAAVETIANIIYCQPDSWIKWVTTILISTAMAFTILSYSEIFATTFQKD